MIGIINLVQKALVSLPNLEELFLEELKLMFIHQQIFKTYKILHEKTVTYSDEFDLFQIVYVIINLFINFTHFK